MGHLDSYLIGEGFDIVSRHPIKDWNSVAREIYSPQREDKTFSNEFDVYLWLTQSLFGSNAVAYNLERDGRLEDNLLRLMKIKKGFRKELEEGKDYPLSFIINLDKMKKYGIRGVGKAGTLSVGDSPLISNDSQGTWDNYFFKYIHTSDNQDSYQFEKQVLEKNGIFDYNIDKKCWEKMVYLGTMRPPKTGE